MNTTYNFSAGPATLPKEVLAQVQKELLDFQGSGMSVTELSHRGKEFMAVAQNAEATLRTLMDIPADYSVLFLQGGATLQFSAVPLNLLGDKKKALYIDSGQWSKKAIKAAQKYCDVDVQAVDALEISDEYAYVHYTPNETIDGIRIFDVPETGDVPLVADMSSMILSEPLDVSKFGLIYAGAQKNIGPAGLTIVIVRNDLLGKASEMTPDVMNYSVMADKKSMLNTPPTFAWYVAGLVFEWITEQGGLAAMQKHNQEKAAVLYDYIDGSDIYSNPVSTEQRSLMNVPFLLKDESLNGAFLSGASEAGLVALKGHRSVGGMRASIYNAMPIEGVQALVDCMKKFETNNT